MRVTLEGGGGRFRLEARADSEGACLHLTAREPDGGYARVLTWQAPGGLMGRETLDRGETADLLAFGIRGTDGRAFFSLRVPHDSDWVCVTATWEPDDGAVLPDSWDAEWRFPIPPGEAPEVFSPALTPEPGDLIGQHLLRSPALTVQAGRYAAALIADPDFLSCVQPLPAAMGLVRDQGGYRLRTGLRRQRLRGHVFFQDCVSPSPEPARTLHHTAHLWVCADAASGAALAAARSKLWAGWGTRGLRGAAGLPQTARDYARQVYPRVLAECWREAQSAGTRVGAVTLDRAYSGDVWFSLWFNALRTAWGMVAWGRRLAVPDWEARGWATHALLLSAPQRHGLFPTVFVFEGETGGRWVGSHPQGGGAGLFRPADMSWTAYHLLRWRTLGPGARSLSFLRAYARGLLEIQRPDGGFPFCVDSERRAVSVVRAKALLADLDRSPGGDLYLRTMIREKWPERRPGVTAEDAASLLFLAAFAAALPPGDGDRARMIDGAVQAARRLEREVFPFARWDDAEVYFSCNPKPLDFCDARSGQGPQGTLPMHLAASGFFALHRVTADPMHRMLARRAMDRLCLYQQVWNPPWLASDVFGGYGCLNTDGEWSDARQAQFAETHLDFARTYGDHEQRERAISAARAAFVQVLLPVSAPISPAGWWREPQGQAAENTAHSGFEECNGVSGFDWGAGSALATAAYFAGHGIEL